MASRIEIQSDIFWSFAKIVYPVEKDWHLVDARIQRITKDTLGLKFIKTIWMANTDDTAFIFEIINYDKYLWAKLKYGL